MPVYNGFYLVEQGSQRGFAPAGLTAKGLEIDVQILVPPALAEYLQKEQKPVPPPISGKGLIDTGATGTCVEDSVLKQLEVAPVGQTTVLTPSGKQLQNLYPASILLSRLGHRLDFDRVMGSQLKEQGLVALLGRDFLSSVVLFYNGPMGTFTLSY